MVLSTSQQLVVAFTAVLFTCVVLPRMFGSGSKDLRVGSGSKDLRVGSGSKELRVGSGSKELRGGEPRYNRKAGPGPGAVRGQSVSMNAPGSAQTLENMQQMKMIMEQEMKSDKYKPNSNKGYVFTLMPLYAVGVGVFAAYKFLKIKSADDSRAQKNKVTKGATKSAEAENQLNELEQRLAQTERMLNSILSQLDPLTICVKSVAQEQKNEIMSQLQTIRHLMKKRGMDCPPLNIQEASCEHNLDNLIESLAAHDRLVTNAPGNKRNSEEMASGAEPVCHEHLEAKDEDTTDGEEMGQQRLEESEKKVQGDGDMEEEEEEEEEDEEEEELDDNELLPSLEDSCETNVEDIGGGQHLLEEQPASGLRRRNKPE